MVFLSLLPAGIYQAWASITKGLWYARSPEIIHSPVMETLVWLRVPGDIVFAVGSVLLAVYALKLLRPAGGPRRRRQARCPRWPSAEPSRRARRPPADLTTMKLTAFTDYSLRVLIYLAADTDAPGDHRRDRRRRSTSPRTTSSRSSTSSASRAGSTTSAARAAASRWRCRRRRSASARSCATPKARRCRPNASPKTAATASSPAACRLKGVLGEAVKAFYAVLDRYTLEDISRNRQTPGQGPDDPAPPDARWTRTDASRRAATRRSRTRGRDALRQPIEAALAPGRRPRGGDDHRRRRPRLRRRRRRRAGARA